MHVLRKYKGTILTTTVVQNGLDEGFVYEGDEYPIAVGIVDSSEPDLITKTGLIVELTYEQFAISGASARPTRKTI